VAGCAALSYSAGCTLVATQAARPVAEQMSKSGRRRTKRRGGASGKGGAPRKDPPGDHHKWKLDSGANAYVTGTLARVVRVLGKRRTLHTTAGTVDGEECVVRTPFGPRPGIYREGAPSLCPTGRELDFYLQRAGRPSVAVSHDGYLVVAHKVDDIDVIDQVRTRDNSIVWEDDYYNAGDVLAPVPRPNVYVSHRQQQEEERRRRSQGRPGAVPGVL
jgi:hypothetical protein